MTEIKQPNYYVITSDLLNRMSGLIGGATFADISFGEVARVIQEAQMQANTQQQELLDALNQESQVKTKK